MKKSDDQKRHMVEMAAAAVIGVCMAAGVFLIRKNSTTTVSEVCRPGLFSWKRSAMQEEREEEVQRAMAELGCEIIYQEIPDSVSDETVTAFLKRRKQQGQAVFALAGEAEWAMEEDAASMKKVLERISQRNSVSGDARIEGIVWDVEPYLLEEWDTDRPGLMETYVENLSTAYRQAKEEDLLVIVCIPHFYDSEKTYAYLDRLVKNGCDAVAVMNYSKRNEIRQLAGEAELAKKYGRGLINITELQEPGSHSLTAEQTYYEDGTGAVRESQDRIRKAYPETELGFAWHCLEPALELLDREEPGMGEPK